MKDILKFMKKNRLIFYFIFLSIIMMLTGCISTTSSNNSAPSATGTPLVPQSITPSTSSFPTINATTQLVIITSTIVQPPIFMESKPIVNNLQFRKNYFYSSINNCPMQEIFPAIAKDPNYGLNQPVPKITAISVYEYNAFVWGYTEGKNENTKVIGIARCQGAIVTPYWNFVQITAGLIPTNPRPSNYTIFLNIRSKGKIIAQFITTELLVKDQMVTLTKYVPLKVDELDIFDSVEIAFEKLPN